MVKRRKPRMNDIDRDVRTNIPSQKWRKRHGTPFPDAERAGTAARFMTQIVPTKLSDTPHDDAERAGTLMNGENSSRSEPQERESGAGDGGGERKVKVRLYCGAWN